MKMTATEPRCFSGSHMIYDLPANHRTWTKWQTHEKCTKNFQRRASLMQTSWQIQTQNRQYHAYLQLRNVWELISKLSQLCNYVCMCLPYPEILWFQICVFFTSSRCWKVSQLHWLQLGSVSATSFYAQFAPLSWSVLDRNHTQKKGK